MAKSLLSTIVISMIALNSAWSYGKKKSKKNTPEPTPYPTEEVDCGMTGKWLDRDDKWGKGDYERVVDFKDDHVDVCPGGKEPLDAMCRDIYTKVDFEDYDFSSRVKYTYCDERGFLCYDGWAFGACPDFEVQFCCPKHGGGRDNSDDNGSKSKSGSASKSKSSSYSKSKSGSYSKSKSKSDSRDRR